MKIVCISLMSLLLYFVAPCRAQQAAVFQFEQFPVNVYRGHIRITQEFHKDSEGQWEDESGKPALQPKVNFAGEYYLTGHSCGTCCRYYTLDNLHTGVSVKEVSMFNAAEPSPVTKEGQTYVPILFFKPGSKLLLVQYVLDICTSKEQSPPECRQRYYILQKGHFKAISRTLRLCTSVGDEPE